MHLISECLFEVTAAPLPIHIHANVAGRQWMMVLSTCLPMTHVANQDGVPSSWLLLGPVLTVAVVWVVSQWMKHLFLGLPLSLIVTLPLNRFKD